MKKTQIRMNKAVFLGLLILEISKIALYEFWCNYVKPKYVGKAKLCYIDKKSLAVYLKTEKLHVDIKQDAEARFDTSNSRKAIKKLYYYKIYTKYY